MREDKQYTYADYCTWDDGQRWELIDGVPYAMAGLSDAHQSIVGELHGQLWTFLKDNPCKVFTAPFDVRLSEDTVVQPDLLVICDQSKRDGKGIVGAPDMVIEISSPATSRHDKIEKLQKYQEAGAREYWIVDPDDRTVLAFVFEPGHQSIKSYFDDAAAPVYVLEGCVINLAAVFAEQN